MSLQSPTVRQQRIQFASSLLLVLVYSGRANSPEVLLHEHYKRLQDGTSSFYLLIASEHSNLVFANCLGERWKLAIMKTFYLISSIFLAALAILSNVYPRWLQPSTPQSRRSRWRVRLFLPLLPLRPILATTPHKKPENAN